MTKYNKFLQTGAQSILSDEYMKAKIYTVGFSVVLGATLGFVPSLAIMGAMFGLAYFGEKENMDNLKKDFEKNNDSVGMKKLLKEKSEFKNLAFTAVGFTALTVSLGFIPTIIAGGLYIASKYFSLKEELKEEVKVNSKSETLSAIDKIRTLSMDDKKIDAPKSNL